MHLESGAAKTDGLWSLGLALACIAYAGWFFFDWQVRYPKINHAKAQQELATLMAPQTPPQTLSSKPRRRDFEALLKSEDRSPEAIRKHLGEPIFSRIEGATTHLYYASQFGKVQTRVQGSTTSIDEHSWQKWKYDDEEVEGQFYWAFLPLAFGAYFLLKTVRAFTLRVRIDDNGMQYAGLQIPFADMARLVDYSRKGWVDLYYKVGGSERRLRIDNQKVAKFDEIIESICRVKGFPDPRPAAASGESSGA